VLHFTGILDEMPGFSVEQANMLKGLKTSAVKRANGFRASVHRHMSPEAMQYIFDKERMGAFGLASGAFVGSMF
jgi:hypothetical protein